MSDTFPPGTALSGAPPTAAVEQAASATQERTFRDTPGQEAYLTEWKRVENTLRDSDEKYRLLIENANESIFIAQDGVVRCPNPKMLQIVGYTAEELSKMPFSEIVAPEDREMVVDRHRRRLLGEPVPNQYQFRLMRRYAEPLWIEINVVRIDWEDRPATLCFVRDISEQKKAEEALRDSQALYHSLVESLPLSIFRKDLEGRFTFGNRRFCELVGCPLEQLIGRSDEDLFSRERAEQYRRDDAAVRATGLALENVEEHRDAAGQTVYLQVLRTPVVDAQQRIIGVQGIFRDITERKRAEEALEKAREIAERENLEREVTEISTRERQRISQDLHDSVGQELTGLSYMAKSLARKLAAKNLAEAAAAGAVVEGIQSTLSAVRGAIRGLTPVEVDANGLMAALQQLTTTSQARCDIECRFEYQQLVPVEDNNTATQLFRITQEAVSNAVKHSQATRIVVRLDSDGHRLLLSISDNGVGFDGDAQEGAGMGLRIMRYRALMIGAELSISRRAGGGTRVDCTLPVETPRPAAALAEAR